MKLNTLWRILQVFAVICIIVIGLSLREKHKEQERINARLDARGHLIQALFFKDARDVSEDIVMMRQSLNKAQLTVQDIDVTEKIVSETLISGYVSMIDRLKEQSQKTPDLMGGPDIVSTQIKIYTERILEERKKFPNA